MKEKSMNKVVILVLLAVVGILIYALVKQTAPVGPAPEQETSSETAMEEKEETVNDAKSFASIHQDNWEHTERAEEAVQDLAEGQILRFGVVEDPTDENISYFATSVFDEENDEMLISIYEYRTDDYTWERLFRATYGVGDFSQNENIETPVAHVVGYDSGRLVIVVRDINDEPGECVGTLLVNSDTTIGLREVVSMSIDEPYSGFEGYALERETREELLERQEACLANS